MRLEDTTIRSLGAPRKGQKLYRDDALTGFGCRVSQGGTKTFVVVHGPDRRTITIGRYPVLSLSKARGEAKRLLAEFTLGRSRPQSISFPDALEAFLKDKAQARRPSTVYGYRKILERLRFKGPVSQITHAEAARKLDRITAPGAKSHAIVAGKVFFNWCIKRRYITENPLIGITKPKGQKRKRVLSDAELKAVWNACAELGTFGTIVRLFILCGQRSREVAALRGEFFADDICTLPDTLTKNHRIHPFPIGALFRQHLPTLPTEGPLFSFNNWGLAKASLDRISGVKAWTLHDLRRTFRTNLGRLGIAPHIAERLVNHVSAQSDMEQTYNLYAYLPEMRAAIERWEAHLTAILG